MNNKTEYSEYYQIRVDKYKKYFKEMTVFAEEQDVNGENKVEIWVDDCIY